MKSNLSKGLPLVKAGSASGSFVENTDGGLVLKGYKYSGGENGIMAAVDKTKLDLIEDGATHNELACFTEKTVTQGKHKYTVREGHDGLVKAEEREKLQNLNFIYRGEVMSFGLLPRGEVVLPGQTAGKVEKGDVYKVKTAYNNIPAGAFYYFDDEGWCPMMGNADYVPQNVLKTIVGTYIITPVIKNVTAEIKVNLIYPLEYDAFKVSIMSESDVSAVEESDFVKKGSGFRTAAAVFYTVHPDKFELKHIKVDFYLKNKMVLSSLISDGFPSAFENGVTCGALVNFNSLV